MFSIYLQILYQRNKFINLLFLFCNYNIFFLFKRNKKASKEAIYYLRPDDLPFEEDEREEDERECEAEDPDLENDELRAGALNDLEFTFALRLPLKTLLLTFLASFDRLVWILLFTLLSVFLES